MEMREAHFPGRAPIDAYGNGGFRFAGMSHRGSILMLPSGIYGWNVAGIADLTPGAFERILAEAEGFEMLLIGTGAGLALPPGETRAALAERRIGADFMPTGAAVRTYNVLVAEGRAVAAGLIAV